MDKPRTYWDTFTTSYQMGRQKHRLYLLDLMRSNGVTSLLDVGCGTGPIYEILKQDNDLMVYKGVDYSPAMIEVAKKSFPEASFEVEDARKLSEENSSWDCVLLMHCLDHLDDYKSAIKEAARVSKKYVCIVLWRSFIQGPENHLNDRNMYGKKEDEAPWEDTHLQEYSKERLDEEFEKNNLKVVKIADGEDINEPGKYNWLVFLKNEKN